MRVIFEEDVENCDFLEIIISPMEVEKLSTKGLVQEFVSGFSAKRNLNIYIRISEED
jgi:hypothetical protein